MISPNVSVGYAAESNVQYDNNTQIVYVTSGHLRRKMLSQIRNGTSRGFNFCDVLIVDEIHSGSVDNTLIISLWVSIGSKGIQVPRLLLMSATPITINIPVEISVYSINLNGYPIDIRYIDKDINAESASGELYIETARLAISVHKTLQGNKDNGGHMLIFAPGSNEVETIARLINEGNLDNAIVITAFGSMQQSDISKIYEEPKEPNTRKIIIATNLAESSITLPGLGIVIDTLVEKRAETSMTGGFRLSLRLISKDSARQRSGRTGRTRPGICYRMCTKSLYDKLEDHRPSEIDRVPIHNVVMELYDVGLSPTEVLTDAPKTKIIDSLGILTNLGFLQVYNGNYRVTDMGHFAPAFPLGIRNIAVLWNWIHSPNKYPIFPCIVAVSLIDCFGPPYFWYPRRSINEKMEDYYIRLDAHREKYFNQFRGPTDVDTMLNMWSSLTTYIRGIDRRSERIFKWCQNNSINNKKIQELLQIIHQCIKALERAGYKIDIGSFTTAGVITALRPILKVVYGDMTLKWSKGLIYIHNYIKESFKLDTRQSINEFTSTNKPPKTILGIITAEIVVANGGVTRPISCAVDVED